MFKWVACLCATLYFTLLIFGAPPEGEAQSAAIGPQAVSPLKTLPAKTEEPVIEPAVARIEPAVVRSVSAEPEAEVIEAAATKIVPEVVTETLEQPAGQTISDIAKAVKPTRVAQPKLELASVTPVTAPEPEPSNGVGEIRRVTGSTVNLRAGASTQSAVLGRARRGDSAEVVELLNNGWAKVYVLESGIEAFMSADYLARDVQ